MSGGSGVRRRTRVGGALMPWQEIDADRASALRGAASESHGGYGWVHDSSLGCWAAGHSYTDRYGRFTLEYRSQDPNAPGAVTTYHLYRDEPDEPCPLAQWYDTSAELR